MFAKFYAAKNVKTESASAHVVRDSHTHTVIASGTYAECGLYQNAFDLCYVEAA